MHLRHRAGVAGAFQAQDARRMTEQHTSKQRTSPHIVPHTTPHTTHHTSHHTMRHQTAQHTTPPQQHAGTASPHTTKLPHAAMPHSEQRPC
eukprot:364233-Chlamydomonas_euryale.AAC.15